MGAGEESGWGKELCGHLEQQPGQGFRWEAQGSLVSTREVEEDPKLKP